VSLNGKRIAVVIPALNEEQSIGEVLRAMPSAIDVVVVCDNGSTDSTSHVARAGGATVVYEPKRGYGAACLAALAELEKNPPDIVAFIDADFSDNPTDLLKVIQPVSNDGADLCIGSRNSGIAEKGSLTPVQRFGNWLSTGLIDVLWGVRFSDLGPMRAISWQALEDLQMRDTSWGWTVEMQLKAAKQKMRCTEVDVQYRNRIGVSKISGTVCGSIKAGTKILYTIAQQSTLPLIAVLSFLGIFLGTIPFANSDPSSSRLYAVMFSIAASALWLIGGYVVHKLRGLSKKLTYILLAVGIVGHFAMAPALGLLTDDHLRYEWDGKLMANGVSPFAELPTSEALAKFNAPSQLTSGLSLPDSLPFSNLETIYPPAAQFWFELQYRSLMLCSPTISPVLAWKLPTLFAIALSLLAGMILLKRSSLSASYILLVLFSPLLLIHATADAHVDVAMILFCLAGLVLSRYPLVSGALWGWAALTKFLPLLFLPALVWRYRTVNRFVVVVGALLIAVTGYVFFAPTATQGSLSLFINRWESNGAFFKLLKTVLSNDAARIVVSGAFGIMSVVTFVIVRNKFHAAVFIMMFLAILSPVLHPWYLLPLLFALPFFRLRSGVLLCATISLSSLFYFGYKKSGMWFEHPAVLAFEFLPVVLLLTVDIFQYLRTNNSIKAGRIERLKFRD